MFSRATANAFPRLVGSSCSLAGWEVSALAEWPRHGERERCFCAYADLHHLSAECPRWRKWASADGLTPNRVWHHGTATILGSRHGDNATSGRYAFVNDWATDLGSGFGAECRRDRAPDCVAVGAHVLSLPRGRYLRDCCDGGPTSLASLLPARAADGGKELCGLLRDMVHGALLAVPRLEQYESCRAENTEPTARNRCLAQCFHVQPDVFFLHLHTTAGVLRTRIGPTNSGLGPAFNASGADDASVGFGRYNLCVCEPREWARSPLGRGSCPDARPAGPEYVGQSAVSLCRNLAAVAGADQRACEVCRPRGRAT
jgi:hypothetical protein